MADQEEKRIIVKVAYNYFQEGKWDRALEEYKKLIDIDPMDFLVHNMMAEIFSRKGEKQEAINEFLKSANLLRATNNLDKAIQTYLNILKIDANNEEALNKINETIQARLTEIDEMVKRGAVANALETCERLAFKIEHPSIEGKIAELQLRCQGLEPKPNAPSSDQVATSPGLSRGMEPEQTKNEETVDNLLGLAEHYEKKESWDEAVEAYITLLRMQPDNVTAQNRLRLLYRRVTQKDKSETVWKRITSEKKIAIEQAKKIGKNQPKPKTESAAAKLLVQAGLDNAADNKTNSSGEMDRLRQQAEEKLRLAVQDRRDRERQRTQSSASAEPVSSVGESGPTEAEREHNIQVLLTQAQMYIQQNLLIEAMRLAQNILELDPQNKDVRGILKQIYEKKNL